MAEKILVVEDEPTNQEVAEVILASEGFEVLLAGNGQEGIDMARRAKPDLIVMDILMPVLDGLSATRELKSDPETAHIPILVVTAKASHSDRGAAEAAGCDAFLAKPYRNSVLVEAIRQLLPARSTPAGL